MIVFDAVYINNSGGKVLLEYLVTHMYQNEDIFYLLDSRLSSNIINELIPSSNFKVIKAGIERFLFYLRNSTRISKVFCFANVPPPVPLSVKVFIYFHNVLLIDVKNNSINAKGKLKNLLKFIYIKALNKNNYTWIVQTGLTEKKLRKALLIKNSSTLVLPFFDLEPFRNLNKELTENNNKFLYIASGEDQKNHSNLLSAWEIALKGRSRDLFQLHLTISPKYIALINRIKEMSENGYKIINHGLCSKDEVKALYSNCNFLIFPSFNESFGLPLIEAALANCRILASDMPFTYEVIEPSLAFDPYNITDISSKLSFCFDNKYIKRTTLKAEDKIDSIIKLVV